MGYIFIYASIFLVDSTTPYLHASMPTHSVATTLPTLPAHSVATTLPTLPTHSVATTLPTLPSYSVATTSPTLPSFSAAKTSPQNTASPQKSGQAGVNVASVLPSLLSLLLGFIV